MYPYLTTHMYFLSYGFKWNIHSGAEFMRGEFLAAKNKKKCEVENNEMKHETDASEERKKRFENPLRGYKKSTSRVASMNWDLIAFTGVGGVTQEM